MKLSIRPFCLAAALLASALPIVPPAEAQGVERLAPYTGPKLTGEVFLCTSDQSTSGGYWYDESKRVVEAGARIQPQSRATTWRVTLKGGHAEIIRFSGASQTIEEPEIYSLEVTVTGGLLLVWQNRPVGSSPQIITIDPTNSSFVYSSQHVDVMLLRWNRTNVFYGSCRPHA